MTNLRFADDVLLLAPTLKQVTQMLKDLQEEAAPRGLQLHPDKTKILTNAKRQRRTQTSTSINESKIDILTQHDTAKYLGRKLTLHNYNRTELDNRVAASWRKFSMLRHELTSKSYPLNSRLQLFDGTVTQTVLYGSAALTLTKDMET